MIDDESTAFVILPSAYRILPTAYQRAIKNSARCLHTGQSFNRSS